MSKVNGGITKKFKELYCELDNLYESFFELVKIQYNQITGEQYEDLLETLTKKQDLINEIERINQKLKYLEQQFQNLDDFSKKEIFQVCEHYKKIIKTKILVIKKNEDKNKELLDRNIKKITDDINYIKKGRKTLYGYNIFPHELEPRFIDKKR
jgi:predicted transcriptional regulator